MAVACLAAACGGGGEAVDADATRRVVQRALGELRDGAPAAARELEGLLDTAESAAAAAADRPRSVGRRHAAAAAWCRAATTASRELRAVRDEQAVRRARYEEAAHLAEDLVAAARASLRRPGMGRTEAAAAAQAEAQLAHAARLAAARRWLEATAAAERAAALAAGPIESWKERERRFFDEVAVRDWRRLAESTVEESRRRGTTAIVVDKYHRRLTVYRRGLRVASFTVELGANGLERKAYSGDRATPEGRYRVTVKKRGSATIFYKALLIDYPNPEDRARYRELARRGEVPRGAGIGGLIEIHGEGGNGRDWTDGCIALTNQEMDQLYQMVSVGTRVTIVGRL